MRNIEEAIANLSALSEYYQSLYEDYIAEAMLAKAQMEKTQELLSDLWQRQEKNCGTEANLLAHQEREEPEALISSNEVDNLSANGNGKADKKEPPLERDEEEAVEIKTLQRSLSALDEGLSVLKKIFTAEEGKTLHLTFLQKSLSQKLEREVSQEEAELYLNQAVERGYCQRDEYDRHCYWSAKADDTSELSFKNLLGDLYSPQSEEANASTLPTEEEAGEAEPKDNSTNRQRQKTYGLPPSSKIKERLIDTLVELMRQRTPEEVSISDVVDYLYTPKQQQKWSKATRYKVRTSISNALARDSYLGKKWERVRTGVYRGLVG